MNDQVDIGFVASAADAPGTSDAALYRTLLEDVEFHADLGYSTAWLIEHRHDLAARWSDGWRATG